jgi:hypothetical protein
MKHKANGQITLLALSELPAAEKTMNAARMHMMPINGKIIIFLSNKSAYLYLPKNVAFVLINSKTGLNIFQRA